MNTQERLHRLEAGQALPLSRRTVGAAVLAEGELLVQAPATWLAGTVFLPPPQRIVAPAVVPEAPEGSVIAVRASTVVVREWAPVAALSAAAAWARRLVTQTRPTAAA